MKFKLFGLTIEIKKKVSLEKRLIKKYGKQAYDMALIYCKNLTEEGLEETCELAKTNITIFAEAMHEGDVLPSRNLLGMLRTEIYNANEKIRDLKDKWNYLKNLIKSKNAAINNLNAQVYNDKTYKEEQDKKIRDLEDKCDRIQSDKNDADGLIEKLLVKIAEYDETLNKLNNDEAPEPTV